jgi:hypothetical protein
VSGWWVDVEREGGVWAICLKSGTRIEKLETP